MAAAATAVEARVAEVTAEAMPRWRGGYGGGESGRCDSTVGRSTVSDASAAASPPIRAQKKALGESCLLVVVALHLA